MNRFLYITMLLLAVLCIFAGCAAHTTVRVPPPDIRAFEQRSTYQFIMPLNSQHAGVTLLSVPQAALADIQLDNTIDNVLYVKLHENKHLNIDRHLARNLEYVYDRNNRTLKVIFDLPVVYMLAREIHFLLEVGIARLDDHHVTGSTVIKRVSFFWTPHTWRTEADSGFEMMVYIDPNQQVYTGKTALIQRTMQEMQVTNMNRLHTAHQAAIERFVE